MAEANLDSDELLAAPPPARTGIGLPAILATVLVAVAASIGSAFVVVKQFAPTAEPGPEAEEEAVADDSDPLFLALQPSFTVNLADTDLMRYMQVDVEVMATEQDTLDRIENRMPMVRNRLLMLFGSQTYDVLSRAEGKAEVQEKARAEVAAAIDLPLERSGIDAVLFTSLVVQ